MSLLRDFSEIVQGRPRQDFRQSHWPVKVVSQGRFQGFGKPGWSIWRGRFYGFIQPGVVKITTPFYYTLAAY